MYEAHKYSYYQHTGVVPEINHSPKFLLLLNNDSNDPQNTPNQDIEHQNGIKISITTYVRHIHLHNMRFIKHSGKVITC